MVDPEGGFFGSVTNDLVVDRGAERGALLTSRILWTFSAAYARYRKRRGPRGGATTHTPT